MSHLYNYRLIENYKRLSSFGWQRLKFNRVLSTASALLIHLFLDEIIGEGRTEW